ncbi:addiction module protein [Prosthecobacter sp.]|uniref:addiction module protein n=1 Tax=Prosthecobacter sp. TaxID=1965333 RepID=UPI002ABCD885|nr:addiction module protein [Prosthecobacter sp.]MDZ4405817.1 addiction module protein [Prosthecobacter sp.]
MTATVERIKKEIRGLDPSDVEALLRDLQNEYVMPSPVDADEASVEAEWAAEIDRRVQEIEDGTVQLLTAEESERRVDAVFARHGIQRRIA